MQDNNLIIVFTIVMKIYKLDIPNCNIFTCIHKIMQCRPSIIDIHITKVY